MAIIAEPETQTDDEKVVAWKTKQFKEKLGFDKKTAEELALWGADHHTAEKLLNDGCPRELVRKIIAV